MTHEEAYPRLPVGFWAANRSRFVTSGSALPLILAGYRFGCVSCEHELCHQLRLDDSVPSGFEGPTPTGGLRVGVLTMTVECPNHPFKIWVTRIGCMKQVSGEYGLR